MADTLTPNIELTIQTVGGNTNSWGDKANDNFDLIDDKLGDTTAIVTTGGNTTLTDDEEGAAAVNVSGVLSSNATIIFSGRGGFWVVKNATSGNFTLTCKVSGQTGVVITPGTTAIVWCNGTDIFTAAVNTFSSLAANFDANGFNILFDAATGLLDDSSNEQLIFQKTASAVNYWEMTNAATGNAPLLQAVGSDSNVAAKISSKGTGQVQFAIDGTNEILIDTAAIFPNASDGSALGKSANPFSDLYLASGAVVDFAGDVTITHSANLLSLAGGDFSFADNLLIRPELKDYSETVQALGSGGGTKTLNFENGNTATVTNSAAATTLAFSNWPATGKLASFMLIITNGGSQTWNWPAAMRWPGGEDPTLQAAGTDIIVGFSIDAGTTIYGFPAGLAMAA